MQNILNLSTRQLWVMNSMPWPLYSHRMRLWYCLKRWVTSRAGLDALQNRQTSFHCWGNNPWATSAHNIYTYIKLNHTETRISHHNRLQI